MYVWIHWQKFRYYIPWIKNIYFFLCYINKVPFKTNSSLNNIRCYLYFHLWSQCLCEQNQDQLHHIYCIFALFPHKMSQFILIMCFCKEEHIDVISQWQLSAANSQLHCVFKIVTSSYSTPAFRRLSLFIIIFAQTWAVEGLPCQIEGRWREGQSGMQNTISFKQRSCYTFKVKRWKDEIFRTNIMSSFLDARSCRL